jgi:hypothetical protein
MYHGANVVAAKTVVVDNGGGFVKAGYSTDSAPRFFHNAKAVSRANKSYFIGDGIDTCPNPETLYIKRAFEKVRVYNAECGEGFLLTAWCCVVLA